MLLGGNLSLLMSLYQKLCLSRPAIPLVFLILHTGFMAAGLPNFKLDASSDALTLESDRDLDYFREIIERYDTGEILVVTYSPEQSLYSDESLSALKALRDDLATVEGVDSVLSILDVPLLYSPVLGLGDLGDDFKRLLDEGVDLELAQGEFSRNPIYKDTLVGPDGKTTAVLLNLEVDQTFVTLVRERDDLLLRDNRNELSAAEKVRLEEVKEEFIIYRTQATGISNDRVQMVRDIVAKYSDQATIFVGGAPMIANDMMQFIQDDLNTFGVAILVFMVLSLAYIFRQKRMVVLPLLACTVTAIVMIGFLAWVDWRLTVISSNFIALLLIVTLAISIHLLVYYQEHCRRMPHMTQYELAYKTVASMWRPCLYTTLTTIVAFASLVVSGIRPVIDFGWMMTIGSFTALILTFMIVPVGLAQFKTKACTNLGNEDPKYTKIFADCIERFPRGILVVSTIVAIVSGFGITQLKVENRFIDYFKSDSEIHQGMLVIDRSLGGTMSLDVILNAPAESLEESDSGSDSLADDPFADDPFADDPFADDPFADDPFADDPFADDPFADDSFGESSSSASSYSYWWNRSGIRKVEKLHDFLESQPEVGKVNSIATSYKLARDLNAGQELNDIELSILRNRMGDEMQSSLVNPYLSDDVQQTRISTRIIESEPGLSRSELVQRIEDYAITELDFEPEQVRTTGLIVLYNNMLQSLFGSQIQTLAAVFVGIMFMFMLLFKSVKVSLVAIVPNMLGAAIVLGFMGLAGIPLDIMTITIAAIAVGMGVDHEIHYLHRFHKEFEIGGDYISCMRRSHKTIGRAMFYTSAIIVIGFSLLSLSNFIPSIYFGLLTALAMLGNTLLSLVLLPALIVMVKPFGPEPTTT